MKGRGEGSEDPEITQAQKVLCTLRGGRDSSVSSKLKRRVGAVAHKWTHLGPFCWLLRGGGRGATMLGSPGRNASENLMEIVEGRKR